MRYRAANIALGLALLLAPLAGWGQTSEWKWLTGGNLKAVKFIGQKGWIIGDDGNQGIILHTTDGGDTWATQPHNTGKHYFNGMSFTDSANGWIVGGNRNLGENGFILRTRDGGNSWINLGSPTPWNLNSVSFVDTLHAWLTASVDSIFRTTNGGISWESVGMNSAYGPIEFLDTLRGFTSTGVRLAKTLDGGRTWADTILFGSSTTPYLDMVDTLEGWLVGAGEAKHTTNGWRSWSIQPIPSSSWMYGVSFVNNQTGYAVGGSSPALGTIARTTNGGLTWSADSGYISSEVLYGVDATAINAAQVVGGGGALLKTTNAGNTWSVMRNVDIAGSLLNVSFWNNNQGWAVGTYGVITHTSNGGMIWQLQNSGTTAFFWGVDFPNYQKGWVCGEGGLILASSNGGTNWAPQTSNTTMPLFSIDFPDSDTLVGVAVGGYYGPLDSLKGQGSTGAWEHGRQEETALQNAPIRYGISQGSTKCKVQSAKWATNEMLNQVQHDEVQGPRNDTPWEQDTIKPWGTGLDFWKYPWRPEETAPTTPYRTITRTTNGGALWIAQNITGQVPLFGVSFVNPAEGWTCGDPQGGMGVILHTTDSGATWTGQSSNVNQALNWIQFRGVQNGWCVGSNGTALWTTDGGTTWNQGNTGITSVLWSCAFYDNQNGFACGNNGLLIKTVDGGRNWTPDTSKVYANLTAVNALDSTHAWTVGSYGMVLGWRKAGESGVEAEGQRGRGAEGKGIALEQSYPNPMRENCAIGYWLNNGQGAKLSIYDITGRRVRSFASPRMTDLGRHTVIWDGKDETNRKVPPGVYFYQLQVKELTETKKLVKVQ